MECKWVYITFHSMYDNYFSRIRKVFCFDDCNPILGETKTKTGMEIPGTYLDIHGKWINPYFFTYSMKIVSSRCAKTFFYLVKNSMETVLKYYSLNELFDFLCRVFALQI